MLETFVESSEELLQQLAQGLQQRDVAQLKAAAHILKPNLTHLRVWHLLAPVAELDQWPSGFEPEALGPLVASITVQLREVMTQMQEAGTTRPAATPN